MINFCHIAPTAYLEAFTRTNGAHLILAHLVESDVAYRNFYANLDDGKEKIMDNSAFEMYKQGRPMYSTEDLLPMARECRADLIVMSDYPNEPGQRTIDAAEQTAEIYRNEGFGTFFVPQSVVGQLDDYMQCMEWALESYLVDRIGLSILGCPNAYGVERDNKLQRYLSRYAILQEMERRKILPRRHHKIFHCLGMVDGPNEIELLGRYHDLIATWDSSAAVWAGLNGIRFDNSPTGLINGKYEEEVDFSYNEDLTSTGLANVMYNIDYIDRLAGEW
jgi:hypothetical protein